MNRQSAIFRALRRAERRVERRDIAANASPDDTRLERLRDEANYLVTRLVALYWRP